MLETSEHLLNSGHAGEPAQAELRLEKNMQEHPLMKVGGNKFSHSNRQVIISC